MPVLPFSQREVNPHAGTMEVSKRVFTLDAKLVKVECFQQAIKSK